MTSDTSQAKSVLLIQWALVTGSGSISRSVCLCLNHLFFNHQHLARFPQALYLGTFLSELFISHLSMNTPQKESPTIDRVITWAERTRWKRHYGSRFYKYWRSVVFTWAGERQEFGIWTWTPGFYSMPLWASHNWPYKGESAYGRKNQMNFCRSC